MNDTTRLKRALENNSSAKPDKNSRIPYYAGFGLNFAKSVLQSLPQPDIVLDPWGGSGTTMVAAADLGYPTIGYELNPVMHVVASARISTVPINTVVDLAQHELSRAEAPNALLLKHGMNRLWELSQALGVHAGIRGREYQPGKAYLRYCMFKVLKSLEYETTVFDFDAALRRALHSEKEVVTHTRESCRVVLGDATALESTESGSVSTILTSPPYCTRYDYLAPMALELDAIGCNVEELSKRLMGTVRMRGDKETHLNLVSFPASIQKLLGKVHDHPSKQSSTYYFNFFSQYFSDAMRCVYQMHRVLKRGGSAVLVVQNSYYKEVHVDLGELYCDIARFLGLAASVLHRYPVTRVLTSINSASKKYGDHQYFEDVVYLEKE